MDHKERQVRRWFAQLRTATLDQSTKRTIANNICDAVSQIEYGDGEIYYLLHGGLIDNVDSQQPTGILNIPPLKEIFVKYSEIDWDLLMEYGDLDGRPRFFYIAKVIQQAFQLKTLGPPFDATRTIDVLHLSTYEKIPLYSEARSAGVEIETVPSYGFPGLYVSYLERDLSEISSCSQDIVLDRGEKNLEYNRGILYELSADTNSRQLFYIDRKVNIAYQNHFLRRVLSTPEFSDLEPTQQEIDAFTQAIRNFMDQWITITEPREKLQRAITIARDLRFSIIGFCLFELLHEYLTQYEPDVHWVNKQIRKLDPHQGRLWSMRGFTVTSLAKIRELFYSQAERLEKDSFKDFCNYFDREFRYKLFAFIGDKGEHLQECAYNNIFHAAIHDLELVRGGLDLWREPYPPDVKLDLNTTTDDVLIDETKHELVFKCFDCTTDIKQRLAALSTDRRWPGFVDTMMRNQRLKVAYYRAKESLGAHTLKLMLSRGIGCLGIPFQPDSRGELLLTPLAVTANLKIFRVRLEKHGARFHAKRQGEALNSSLTVRDFTDFDPLMRFMFDELYSSAAASHAEAYGEIYRKVITRASKSLRAMSSAIPKSREVVAVVIPFFKEKDSYVKIVADTLKAFEHRNEFLIFVLASNQKQHEFMRNIAQLEAKLTGLDRKRYLLRSINTSEIGSITYWMIEKYLNIHAASALIDKLNAVHLRYVAYLEGDVENVLPWWNALHALGDSLPSIVLFQFQVGVRPEASGVASYSDFKGSDVILAKLFTVPATSVVLGKAIEQLFGGNFVLSKSSLGKFCDYLERSEHVESLVETWIPAIMAQERNCRVLQVDPKIHLPALTEHHFSTDSKFVKWVFDLFYSLEQYWIASEGRELTELVTSSQVEYEFERESEEDWQQRRQQSLLIYSYSQQVYKEILTEELRGFYSSYADEIANAKYGRKIRMRNRLDPDTWTETIIRFFVGTRGRRLDATEEMLYGLRALYDFYLLSYTGTSYLVKWPVPSVRKTEQLRNLIRERIRDTNP